MDELPPSLLQASTCRELGKGETLYCQGEPVKAVFTVVQGRLRLSTCTADGKQIPLYTVSSGECVAEAALFADTYCSDAVAQSKARVCGFPPKLLRDALLQRPALAAEFMHLQAQRCNHLRINLEIRSLRSARERILQFLQMSAADDSRVVKLNRPLKDVAAELGLTHESFYRTFRQLVEEGVLKRTLDTITLIRRPEVGIGRGAAM